MAELNARIIAKASATAGEAPQAADLEVAEIAVNTADGKFFTKHTDGTIKEISGSGSGGGGGAGNLSELNDVDITTNPPTDGKGLIYDSTSGKWETADVVLSVNGETGDASLGIQDMDDYLSSVSPAEGDTLQWDDAEQKFKPSEPFPGNIVSVNDQTGEVSLGIQDMDDYQLKPAGGPRYIFSETALSSPGLGEMGYTGGSLVVNLVDQDGVNWSSSWGSQEVFPQNTPFSVRINGIETTGYSKSNTGFTSGSVSLFGANPNFGTDLVDGDEVEFLIASFPSPSLPLAQGDILQWNDSTQKFNPTAPVQRIQDQKDFQPIPNTSEYAGLDYRLADGSNTSVDATPNGWYLDSNRYLTFGADGFTALNLLSVGDALTMKLAGEADFSTTVSTGVTPFSSSYYLRVSDVPPAAYLDVAVGTPIILDALVFAEGFQPLADGDILRWNDADQKFNPVQLSGTVNSVNGETGVVSLGVQDMDDYELKKATVEEGSWRDITLSSNSSYYNEKGEAAIFLNGERFIVNEFDSDWKDFSGIAAAAVADNGSNTNVTFYVSRDGGTSWQEHVSGYVTLDHSGVGTYFQDVAPALDETTDELLVSFDDPRASVPLAQGNVLRWDSATSKFSPEPFTIQGMDDFELPLTPPTVFRYDNYSDGGNYSSPGYAAALLTDKNRLFAAQYDSNGADAVAATVAAVDAWPGGIIDLPVWVSADGVNWTATFSSFVSTDQVRFNTLFKVSDGTPFNLVNEIPTTGPIYFTMDDPAGTEAPLADNDILQWSDADQKFKPAQLSSYISLTTLKAEVAASTDFADFQSRIAAL